MRAITFFVLTSSLVFIPAISSADTQQNANAVVQTVSLMKSGLDQNFDRIQEITRGFNEVDKLVLNDVYKKSATNPFLMNFFLGLVGIGGVGSLVDGDKKGGTIAICGQFGGEIVAAVGAALIMNAYHSNDYSWKSSGSAVAGMTIAGIGGATAIGFWIYGIVRPFQFVEQYNAKLRKALNIQTPLSVNIAPLITTVSTSPRNTDTAYGLTLGARW